MKRAASEKVLLDANVLVALAWPNHQFHATATNRLDASGERWATCALTHLAFIRLSANPRVVGQIVSPSKAASLLAAMLSDSKHFFIETMTSPAEPPHLRNLDRILGAKQLTELYLLRVAANASARFLTFDNKLGEVARDISRLRFWADSTKRSLSCSSWDAAKDFRRRLRLLVAESVIEGDELFCADPGYGQPMW